MLLRVCAAALAIILPAGAAHSGGVLAISAVIPKTAQLAVRDHPTSFAVTPADIARGYVDIGAGPSLEVKTNSREGLQIGFHASDETVRAVQLRAGGSSLMLGGAPRGTTTHRVALDYRLLLSPAARPGVYAWPVQVVATPL
jgi:hypothetical protein